MMRDDRSCSKAAGENQVEPETGAAANAGQRECLP